MRFDYVAEPHPHLFFEEVADPAVYERLVFPDSKMASPAEAWGLTRSDAEYEEVFRDKAWSSLRDSFTDEEFVLTVLREFAADLRTHGCLVDPDKARVIDYLETREEKQMPVLATKGDPNEVFTRFDLQSKGMAEYRDFVHLDWARRIVGGILFFSDAGEEGLDGGELAFYRDRAFAGDRFAHDPELTYMIEPRHNTGVVFLNSNDGFHGPRAIRALQGRRRWVYFTISSKIDVWPLGIRG
jgi:hypothetical protein